jgi:hypothetical protein
MSDEHLRKYVEYIRNTGREPLAVELFDDDWEPIGPRVRAELVRAGLVTQSADGLLRTGHSLTVPGPRG